VIPLFATPVTRSMTCSAKSLLACGCNAYQAQQTLSEDKNHDARNIEERTLLHLARRAALPTDFDAVSLGVMMVIPEFRGILHLLIA